LIEPLIEALKQYGLAGLGMALFSWLAFDMWATHKKFLKDSLDRDRIFAVKIEAKLDAISGEVTEVQADAARVGGMVQAQQMRRR